VSAAARQRTCAATRRPGPIYHWHYSSVARRTVGEWPCCPFPAYPVSQRDNWRSCSGHQPEICRVMHAF